MIKEIKSKKKASHWETSSYLVLQLEPEVAESLVCICHAVGIFLLLESGTRAVVCIDKLVSKLVGHALAVS